MKNAFNERTSKRRKGYPSETNVKRGRRIVRGEKELTEKLGRNDLCPCGSGRRFQELLPAQQTLRWLTARPLLLGNDFLSRRCRQRRNESLKISSRLCRPMCGKSVTCRELGFHFGATPRTVGAQPQKRLHCLPEGHRPSAHRAAKPHKTKTKRRMLKELHHTLTGESPCRCKSCLRRKRQWWNE